MSKLSLAEILVVCSADIIWFVSFFPHVSDANLKKQNLGDCLPKKLLEVQCRLYLLNHKNAQKFINCASEVSYM